MLSLINLQRALRRSRTPEELGAQEIERGAQKTAYSYTTSHGMKVVIKPDTGGWNDGKKTPPNLKKYGVHTILHIRAGCYCIQEYVTPLRMRGSRNYVVPREHPVWEIFTEVNNNEKGGDYHAANFGVNGDGNLVCFDW